MDLPLSSSLLLIYCISVFRFTQAFWDGLHLFITELDKLGGEKIGTTDRKTILMKGMIISFFSALMFPIAMVFNPRRTLRLFFIGVIRDDIQVELVNRTVQILEKNRKDNEQPPST